MTSQIQASRSAVTSSLPTGLFGALCSRMRGQGGGARSSRRDWIALLAGLIVLVGLVFGAGSAVAAEPTFSIDPTPTAQYTTADASGTINPEGEETYYSFEYSANPATEGWSGFTFSGPLFGSGSQSVSTELTGLKPGTEYQVRLGVAGGFNGFAPTYTAEPNPTFTTKPVPAPTITLDPVTTHTDTTAHFSGTINPNAPAGPLSEAAKAAFKTEWHFECTPECPGLTGGTIEGEEGSQPVSVNATGLEPNTAYEVRLIASNAGGPSTAGPEVLQTTLIPATVKTVSGASDGKGGYNLQGVVNPHNSEVTACRFEYGPTTSYGQGLPCKGTPGTVNKFVEVTAHPTGLTPGATYHYRLVATNGAGPESSGDATFVPTIASAEACPYEAIREEQGTTSLPECRAYELVTAPFKEGFAAVGGERGIHLTDGAVSYSSSGNFAGDGLGRPFNQYLATRSATGWLTTPQNPSGPTYTDGGNSVQGLSGDLRASLWLMRLPDESTEMVSYYVREADGSFKRIGPAFNPATAPPVPPGVGGSLEFGPFTQGESADLSHIVFETDGTRAFPGPAPSEQHNLYEYVGTGNERPQLVGVDNAGNLVSPGGTCAAGMSTDGRVVLFVPECEGQLWARINGTTTIEASASECTRTSSDPGGACNGTAIANYVGAAGDDSRVFFTTTQQLVNGDTNQTADLYACDIPPGTPAPVGLVNPCESLIDVSGGAANANVEGVLPVSADGSRVYFVASGVVAANTDALGESAVSGGHNLYVWQKDAAHPSGHTTFVAGLKSSDVEFPQTTADGRYLTFTTGNQLVPSDTDEAQDVYRYDADTGSMLRLSTDTSGTGGNTPGLNVTLHPNGMSADGSTVVFQTEEGLSPADTNGKRDVYEWHEGQVSLISSGRPYIEIPTEEKFTAISPSGSDIYFTTTAQLIPGVDDTVPDIYDARINGGFSAAQPQPCSGEACQGATTPQSPAPGASASATFNGPGNAFPAETPSASPPKPKPLTRAQKLAKALKACKSKRNKRKRAACGRQARRTYGSSK